MPWKCACQGKIDEIGHQDNSVEFLLTLVFVPTLKELFGLYYKLPQVHN